MLQRFSAYVLLTSLVLPSVTCAHDAWTDDAPSAAPPADSDVSGLDEHEGSGPFAARMLAALIAVGFCLECLGSAYAQSIDACLIGTWNATSVQELTTGGAAAPVGGTGFQVTFWQDGTEIVDYWAMKPLVWAPPPSDTQIWKGAATFWISTDQNAAKLESVGDNNVQVRPSAQGTPPPPFMVGWPGRLGPGALGSAKRVVRYNCGDNSLEYTALDDAGMSWFSVKLARLTLSPPPAPPVAVNGRTWLSATGIKDRPQDIDGVWEFENGTTPLRWLVNSPADRFVDHPMPSRDLAIKSIQMHSIGRQRWEGSIYVVPATYNCPALDRWVPGSVEFDPNNISGHFEWYSKMVKSDCSGFTDEPDSPSNPIKRYIGVSFVPIVAGKYIEIVGSPAVGDRAAQFKAAVRLIARYEALTPAGVRTFADHGTITLIDKANSTYQFLTDQSGAHELRFEAVGGDGQVFHIDRVRIDVPGISGVGR